MVAVSFARGYIDRADTPGIQSGSIGAAREKQ